MPDDGSRIEEARPSAGAAFGTHELLDPALPIHRCPVNESCPFAPPRQRCAALRRPCPRQPRHAGAWAAGPKAYVGNFKDGTVSVVDIDQGKVTSTVSVAAGPDGIVVTPDGANVFVSGSSASSISVIDTASDRVSRSIEVGSGPQGLAVVPGGQRILAAVNGMDRVALIDVASGAVTATVPVPKPHTIAVRPDGTQAYVASQEPGMFSAAIIDLASRRVVGNIALAKPPRDLEFGHDGKALYLTLAGIAAVQVIDPVTNRFVGQVATGVSPHVAQFFAGQPRGVAVVQGPGESGVLRSGHEHRGPHGCGQPASLARRHA
ncbi:MAG: beta-propeller repeat protein [Variovorax sp.]|nr:beta-propeller repeat protein [Variovorax sp.]